MTRWKRNIVIFLGIFVSIGLLGLTLQMALSDPIREAHTKFLFLQVQSLLKEKPPLGTATDLTSLLKQSSIDWNSCRMDGDRILDGWDQPIIIRTESERWTLISAGRDGRFGSSDDAIVEIPVAASEPQPDRPQPQ